MRGMGRGGNKCETSDKVTVKYGSLKSIWHVLGEEMP